MSDEPGKVPDVEDLLGKRLSPQVCNDSLPTNYAVSWELIQDIYLVCAFGYLVWKAVSFFCGPSDPPSNDGGAEAVFYDMDHVANEVNGGNHFEPNFVGWGWGWGWGGGAHNVNFQPHANFGLQIVLEADGGNHLVANGGDHLAADEGNNLAGSG